MMNKQNNYIGGTDLALATKLRDMLDTIRGEGTAMSVSIVREGAVLASAACGTQDGNPDHPATVDDLYNIGSISKVYCAMAVLKLCEMGKVDLDTPVCEYLPHFVMADPRYKKITLRMCLNHSAGLPGTMGGLFSCHPIDSKQHSARFFHYLSHSVLNSEPGSYTVYCNDGFDLASEVVATVSGMPYRAFLKTYITDPLHCPSTCTDEAYPSGRVHIQFKGITQYVIAQGAGGIASDMSDCARFGWAFIEPGVTFSAQSAALAMEPQHLGYDPSDADSSYYGLGWDGVDFRGLGIDLGEGTLIKGGGTSDFYSHLIVSRKHRFSAAISQTGDVGGSAAANLCRLLTLLPDIVSTEEKVSTAYQPVPEKLVQTYTGRYYSSCNHYTVFFTDKGLTVRRRTAKGWEDMVNGIPYNGEVFYDRKRNVSFSFLCFNGYVYLRCNLRPEMVMAIAVKTDFCLQPNTAWCKRNGRKYLLQDGKGWDSLIGEMGTSVEIEAKEGDGIVSAISRGRIGGEESVVITSFAAADDTTTEVFIPEGPHLSRDLFPFFVWEKNGVEHLYKDGFTYVNADSVPVLHKGCICTDEGDTCLAYRIESGMHFSLSVKDARIILLDTDLNILFDSMYDGTPERVGEGFMLLLSEQVSRIDVQ